MVAGYVGQTAIKANGMIEAAMGGGLFIDEAYSLSQGGENDFGREAIETLLKRMEDHRGEFIVIVAGYTDNMAIFLESNPGLKSRFEEHHGVRYTEKALEVASELASRYINERFLPDKAIDVIDEAGAYQRLLPASKRKKTIGVSEIEEVIAKIARIPPKSVSANDKEALRTLDRDLKMTVFGQDDAITALSSAIKLSRAGLKAPEKPVGSFLFAGPTGVGKTEVTKQLAKILGIELVRFDMSEYMERHTVSRLIGAPPGYVGFDQGGLLTEAISKHPHCVLLLDEVEKAHPEVFNLLLQVMDHGTLTDNNGRKSDFRHVIIVMTTNAGAESIPLARF